MNVLLIGSGGREHALAWAIAASPLVDRLYCAPGNAGIAREAILVPLDVNDQDLVARFCADNAIGLVVVGPEAPLVAGLADSLSGRGIKVFGPSKVAAQLEGSKGFTKDLCARHGIPTAAYARFADESSTLDVAEAAVREAFAGRFGAAGAEVVIEDRLEGEEASFFALCDGRRAIAFGTAQDHKRVGDGDTGPNTGGMGAYSPASIVTPEIAAKVMDEIISPTVAAMAAEGAPFVGVLYAGLMLTAQGPQLIEYNVRFGDPEAQVLMMRLKDDIVTLMLAAVDGALDKVSVRWRDEAAVCVVMAARGYPGETASGTVIRGLELAEALTDTCVFHAATARQGERIVAAGGRVLGVTALGQTVGEARRRAYDAADMIDWPEGFCRRDIGWREVKREAER
jgi:phosphoribosylamine---glycine ligase